MDAEFTRWQELWDKASKDFETKKPDPAPTQSFFGLYQQNPDLDEVKPEEADHWREVYYKAQRLWTNHMPVDPDCDEEIVTEAKKEKKKETVTAKKPTKDGRKDAMDNPNPIVSYSAGKDGESEDEGGVMVTANFSSGPELEQLMDLMKAMSDIEGEFLTADILGKSKKSSSLQSRWKDMKKKAQKLSDALQPKGKDDVG